MSTVGQKWARPLRILAIVSIGVGGIISVAALGFVAFAAVLLANQAAGFVKTPVAEADMIGTWSSRHDGKITFAADGTVHLHDVPLRGAISELDASARKIDRTDGWIIQHRQDGSNDGTVCRVTPDTDDCMWAVTTTGGHLELDLIVGDPDSRDWYRYVKITP
ncbi:hypothetical protein [Frondihabitans sp. PhB188]|uniref:hypothetical protein n=1 Tax=Frondihabitans sp. PhB188 TaxID=2485200 RepID=UPI0013151512|nr:hypothetical protein [Frondihabitans sp. PhB188]